MSPSWCPKKRALKRAEDRHRGGMRNYMISKENCRTAEQGISNVEVEKWILSTTSAVGHSVFDVRYSG
jgi:hypothetical protein